MSREARVKPLEELCEECCSLTACDTELCTEILGHECICCPWLDEEEEFDDEEEYEDDKELLEKVVYNVY